MLETHFRKDGKKWSAIYSCFLICCFYFTMCHPFFLNFGPFPSTYKMLTSFLDDPKASPSANCQALDEDQAWNMHSTIEGQKNAKKWLQNTVVWVIKVMKSMYSKVASSRPVYYSILNSFGQRSQYISIKFPFINSLKILKFTNRDSLLFGTLRICNTANTNILP